MMVVLGFKLLSFSLEFVLCHFTALGPYARGSYASIIENKFMLKGGKEGSII